LVNRCFRDIQTNYVIADNCAGACEAVEHLIRLGHRRIGCIGWVECTAVEDRLRGYRLALGRHAIPYDEMLVRGILDEERQNYAGVEPASGGYQEMKQLLQLGQRPDAVFAVSDRLAVGAMRAITEAGLQIPGDVALVGFDDVRYAADLDLTTVAQPAFETGKTAAEILIGQIEGGDRNGSDDKLQQIVLPTRLIVRGSCGGQRL
jgi:DNA-binding LacI/PurR family transcriptional regulator